MTATETAAPTYTPLLTVLTQGRAMPRGCDAWGFRAVHPDFSSRNAYRWVFPCAWAHAPGPIIESNTGPCPAAVGDGLCVAHTIEGVTSTPIPTRSLLVVAYHSDDLLGGTRDKVRVRKAFVVDIVDLLTLAREGRLVGTDLHGTNLRGLDLHETDLHETDLSDASLRRADLHDADLHGALLNVADLCYSDLRDTDLRDTCLFGTCLTGAETYRALFTGACTDEACRHGNVAQPRRQVPQPGA